MGHHGMPGSGGRYSAEGRKDQAPRSSSMSGSWWQDVFSSRRGSRWAVGKVGLPGLLPLPAIRWSPSLGRAPLYPLPPTATGWAARHVLPLAATGARVVNGLILPLVELPFLHCPA